MNERIKVLVTGVMLVVFMLIARHALAPVTDYVADDWSNLMTVDSMSYCDIIMTSMRDVYRPTYNTFCNLVFRTLGDNPLAHSVLSEFMQALLVLGVWVFVWSLSGSGRTGILAALFFCVLPIINEPFYFHTTSTVLFIPLFYILSLTIYNKWLDEPKRIYLLVLSCVFYGLAVFGYEYGVFIVPLYYALVLLRKESWKRAGIYAMPIFAIACYYLLWRFTKGFGFGLYTIVDGSYYFNEPLTPHFLFQNTRHLISWWIGFNFWQTMAQGILGFQTLLPKFQFMVLLINALVIVLALWAKNRLSRECPAPNRRHVLFFAMFVVLGYLPFVLSAAHSRHNLFPSIGACALLAIMTRKKYNDRIKVQIILILLILMVTSQGLATYWQDQGTLHRKAYNALSDSECRWGDAEIILIDTSSLRYRLTPGLSRTTPIVEYYGPSILPRSWVYSCMLKLHYPHKVIPTIAMDQDCGAVWSGDVLEWHERFNPSKPRETKAESIAVFDAFGLKFVEPPSIDVP